MKYLSLFSGIGGFELGIQQAYEDIKNREHLSKRRSGRGDSPPIGSKSNNSIWQEGRDSEYATCVGYSEVDKYAIQIYEKHFNHKNHGDATKIDTKQLPDFDLLVGGFPCQAFSVAGKRKGFDDTRGTLFFDIARILADKKPKHFILENVKGLLSHDSGNTFTTIIRILTELGYFVEWQVLNAKNFGVPQNRERVFIVGYLGGTPRPKVFPIGESNPVHLKEITQEVSDAQRIYESTGLAKSQKALGGGLGAKTGLYAVLTPDRPDKRQNGRRIKDDGEPSFTLTGQDIHGIAIDMTRREESNYRIRKDGRAGTLDANYYKGLANQERPGVLQNMKIRRLTPKECERLMGYPDDWTLEGTKGKISDTQRYKMCGNGVVSNVVKVIIEKLLFQD